MRENMELLQTQVLQSPASPAHEHSVSHTAPKSTLETPRHQQERSPSERDAEYSVDRVAILEASKHAIASY